MALTAVHPRTIHRNHTPLWLMLSGVVIAVIGAIIAGIAANQKDAAANLAAYGKAYGSNYGQSQVDAAVSLGHFGLGVLIFGLALTLVGIAAQAVRQH